MAYVEIEYLTLRFMQKASILKNRKHASACIFIKVKYEIL